MTRKLCRFALLPFAASFAITLPIWHVVLNILPNVLAR